MLRETKRRLSRGHTVRGLLATTLLLLTLLGACLLVVPSSASALDCGGVDTSVIGGDACEGASTTSSDSSNNPVISVLKFVMQVLMGAVGIAAVGALIYAGIMYSSAGGESSQVQKAKTLIKDTVIGIVAFSFMIIILNFVIPGGVFGQQGVTGGGTVAHTPDESGGGGSGGGSGNGKAGSTYNLTLGTWNTKFDNKQNVGSGAKSLMSSVDVLGLQELHYKAQRTNVSSIASDVIGVQTVKKSADGHMVSYPILYNKTKLSYVSSGYKLLTSVPGRSERYIVWARFKVKTTEQEFYFVGTHLPPNVQEGSKVGGGATDIAAYKKAMPVTVSTIKGLQNDKIPLFFVGDLNVDYRQDDCTVTWWPCKSLKAINLKSSFEYTNLSGISGSTGSHGSGKRLIDYIWAWDRSDTKITGASIVNASSNGYGGSDHKPSIAKVTITTPNSSTGQSSANSSQTTSSAAVTLSGVKNFRDVSTLTPSLVKPGVLYRSAKLHDATTKDVTTLSTLLKNGLILDLRTSDKAKAKDTKDKDIPGVTNTNYDINGKGSAKGYIDYFIKSKTDRQKIGKAITDIANAKGSVLVHCTYGKDRTGWTVAMIMYILGASDAQVKAEYIKSLEAGSDYKVNYDGWFKPALAAARKDGERTIMEYITSSSDGLGVSQETITLLKAKLGAKS